MSKPVSPKSFAEGGRHLCIFPGRSAVEKPDHRHCRVLRAVRQRLRHRRTAQQCDELASFQMIKLHLTAPARDFAAIGQDRVRGLPRCEISARLTAASGQTRSFGDVGSMSQPGAQPHLSRRAGRYAVDVEDHARQRAAMVRFKRRV